MQNANGSLLRRCRGQALVETVVAALFVLVPIFLITPLLGKYIDLKAQTLQAARYTAFERTAFAANNSLNDGSVNQATTGTLGGWTTLRFFGAPTGAIKSAAPSSKAYTVNPLWVSQSGAAFLPKYKDVKTTLTDAASPDDADDALQTYLDGVRVLSNNGPNLDFNGLVTAHIEADAAPVIYPPPFNTMKLQFTGSDTLLTDAWSATGPGAVQTQVQSLLPRLEPALKTVMNADKPFARDLNSLNLEQVLTSNPQEVPADRLKAAKKAPFSWPSFWGSFF